VGKKFGLKRLDGSFMKKSIRRLKSYDYIEFDAKEIVVGMAKRKLKTEHAGAKNGEGHWGKRHEAKKLSTKARREAGRLMAKTATKLIGADEKFPMIRLDCSKITFYSQHDEEMFFGWGEKIPSFSKWDQDMLVLKGKALSDRQFREIIALFYRYKVPMQQLKAFENSTNAAWLNDPKMYWHKSMYG
jgi:hypothetical protein